MNPEPLKEIQPEPRKPPEIPPCDIKYITVYLARGRNNFDPYWTSDWHLKREAAEADAEYAVPGTLRIFEVPPKERN